MTWEANECALGFVNGSYRVLIESDDGDDVSIEVRGMTAAKAEACAQDVAAAMNLVSRMAACYRAPDPWSGLCTGHT